jgi:hypothetical protein
MIIIPKGWYLKGWYTDRLGRKRPILARIGR